MGQIADFVPSGVTARQFAARLANVVLIMPACEAITDTPGSLNSLNVKSAGGFLTPNAAPGAAVGAAGALTGDYAYYVTFYDSNTDTEGPPSAQSVTVTATADRIDIDFTTITNEATNPRVTHFRLYRNLNGGAIYYRVTTQTIATASYTDNATDASIQSNDTLLLNNTAPASSTYGFIATHKNFGFMLTPYNQIGGTDYDHDVTWSKVGNLDAWPSVNRTKVARGQYGILRGFGAVGDVMLLYKDSAIIRWTFDTNPSGTTGDGHSVVVNAERGALNARCVVNAQGTHFVMDTEGIYATRDGETIVELDKPLRKYWKRINWRQRAKFCGVWTDDRVMFSVALDGDTECHHVFVFDLVAHRAERGSVWWVYKYDFGIRDMDRIRTGNSAACQSQNLVKRIMPMAIDDHGRLHIMNIGYRDGVHPRLTASGTITTAVDTTHFIDADGVFSTTNADGNAISVKDMYLHFEWPSTLDQSNGSDEKKAYRITAIGGTGNHQLAFTPATPATLPGGTRYYIGASPDSVYKTPQMSFGDPFTLKKASICEYEMPSGGLPFSIKARVSNDRLAPWEQLDTADSDQSLFTTQEGSQDITLKMGGDFDEYGRRGIGYLPMGGRAFSYAQIELDASTPDSPARIDSYRINTEPVGDDD